MGRAYFTLFAIGVLACGDDAPSTGDGRADGSVDASQDNGGKRDSGALKDAGGLLGMDASQDKSEQGLPCAVETALANRCWTCHDKTPQGGAPMSLTSIADLHAVSARAGAPYYQGLVDRVQRTSSGMMPPASQPRLSDDEKKTLLDWANAGAPTGAACAQAPIKDAGTQAPDPVVDCDVQLEFRAHGDWGATEFPVPLADDHYECFYIPSTIDANTLGTQFVPLLDKTQVLHHWLLFAADNQNESPNGTHRECNGIHPGAALVAAWLPGTPTLTLPDDVGMELPSGPNAQFILENHYNNVPRYLGMTDTSGVKVCATKKPKSQHAAIHWLGSEQIYITPGAASATGTCTPKKGGPIHIMGIVPHMHKMGRHVTMKILRANGSTEPLHDAPFEFEAQGYYAKDVVLQPGDRISTKCDYENNTFFTAVLGEQTSNEMCYMFTLAYPVGLMNVGTNYVNPITQVPYVQGPNRCLK